MPRLDLAPADPPVRRHRSVNSAVRLAVPLALALAGAACANGGPIGEEVGSGGAAAGAGGRGTGGMAGMGGAGGCTPPAPGPLVGWASMSGSGVTTTTGGGSATPTTVSTLSALNSAAAGTGSAVIWVQGS